MSLELEMLKESVPFKWRVQSYSKSSANAICVAYIDARDVMDILDAVVGMENWQSDYKEIKGNLYAGIGIRINDEWVWKWDCGTESKEDKQKGEASDSFKRAGVKWGIGRFLYDIPIQYVKANEPKKDNNYPYPIDDEGNKIKNLSDHINNREKVLVFQNRSNNFKNKTNKQKSIDETTKDEADQNLIFLFDESGEQIPEKEKNKFVKKFEICRDLKSKINIIKKHNEDFRKYSDTKEFLEPYWKNIFQ